MSRNIWGRALYVSRIPEGISFVGNTCLQSVQKYQIILTQRWIRRFRISKLCILFCPQTPENWGQIVSGLVLRRDKNVLLDSIFIKLQNGLLYYCQPLHNPTSVAHLGLNCKVEYNNANQGIMPDAHNIWVQSEKNDLDNTFQGRIPSLPVFYFCWTPLYQIFQFPECVPAGKQLSTFSKRRKETQQWVFCRHTQEYALVIPRKSKDIHSCADCIDRFIWVVKQMDKMHSVPFWGMVGPAHLVGGDAATDGTCSVWLANNDVDLDACWTVYWLD